MNNIKSLIIDIYYLLKKDRYRLVSDSEFSDLISDALQNKKPLMAGRMGAYESSTIRMIEFGYKAKQKKMMKYLSNNAGFFPDNLDLLPRFAQVYTKALSNCDILHPMRYKGENYLVSKYATKKVRFCHDFFDISGKNQWLTNLEGMRVLVIHPFADTIKRQYSQNRQYIHKESNYLPPFELIVQKAVFTAAGEVDDRFDDWFEALDYMHKESMKINYDIALIGCGAYGFPLASMIKNDGKVAVHMGGGLQLLFGIKGARWEQGEDHGENLYNEYWTYADPSERPRNFASIEGSSYWEPPEKLL